MKGLHFSFLAGIILVVIIVAVGFMLLMPVAGFDVKKYFGLQPILGTPGELGFGDIDNVHPIETTTRCKKFYGWIWSESYEPIKCDTNGDIHFCTFKSPECPPNTYPVSCATRAKYGNYDKDSGKKYADAIIAIYNDTNNACAVVAKENPVYTGTDQARVVGVLCASLDPTEIEYKWGGWENADTIGIGVSCSSGYSAISGMVDTDLIFHDNIEDQIVNISQRYAKLKDPAGSAEYQKKFGKVCIKDNIFNECGIKEYFSPESVRTLEWFSESMMGVSLMAEFTDQPCPGDSQIIFCGGGFNSPQYASTLVSLDTPYFKDKKTGDTSIQTCELVYGEGWTTYPTIGLTAICAENLWHWSGWITSTDAYPLSFTSPLCPDGTKAIACASDTASLENGYGNGGSWPLDPGGGKYGEDAINSIFITADKKMCIVRARDKYDANEHKRRVGVLCINETIYTSDFSYKEQAFSQASGNDFVTFESPSCDDGYLPVYCTVKMDATSDAYKEDQITEIDIDVANRKCKVTLADQSGTKEFKGDIGVMCAKADNIKIKNDWNNIPWKEVDFENPFFKSVECSSGFATTALTITELGDAYKEDYLISMLPTSGKNSFVIQPEDTVGVPSPFGSSNEHKRKVGVVCLNYPEDAFK